MTDCYSGPYRATALWNEAVLLFRENMVLKEHRHRFHKHKNSFTGHEAVTLLLNVLCSNPMFNPSVSREQCCRLLRQFLKADLISPVKSCSLSHSKTTFYDSNKYLYEFTDQLVNFEPLQPISVSNIKEQKTENFQAPIDKEKYCSTKCDGSTVWKYITINRSLYDVFLFALFCEDEHRVKFWPEGSEGCTLLYSMNHEYSSSDSSNCMLYKIAELVKPLNIFEITNFTDINPSWVEMNANPECLKHKWNTELPQWILSAIHDIIKYTSKDYCGTAYPNFEMDAYQLITDYFKTLDVPLIDHRNYDLYTSVFHHLEYLNCMESVKSPKKNFQEELPFRGVTSIKKKNSCVCLPDKVLPPNHCYEAAFTSDDPTIRVVPQSSVDSIHLRKKTCVINYGRLKMASSENGIEKLKDFHDSSSNIHFFKGDIYKRNRIKKTHAPLKSIDNFIDKQSSDVKHGIINEGFIVFSPDNKRRCEVNFLVPLESDDFYRKKELVQNNKYQDKENQYNNFIYVNHGLSFSLEDINLLDHNLDYNYALESLNNLMKVTQNNQSLSDDDHSFHTALSHSEFELSDTESSSGNVHTQHSCEIKWDPNIIDLGSHVFQLLLVLLPPCDRAKLKYLCLLLYKVSRNLSIPEFTLHNMLLKLEGCILRPMNVEASDLSTVHNILAFIVTNHKTVFAELPFDLLSNIKNELYEKQLKKSTSCDQLNIKKNEDSKHSLTQLLDHILQNDNISEKEKKKHLKLFKNCYPGIYRSRFPNESKPTKTRALFSIKNLRL